jgi:4-diphosphocytidyl-2-C-methyl-D-erythritol kinase
MQAELEEPSTDGSLADGHDFPLVEFAPAKINLTLAVSGRRADGFHELASLVAFASIGDEVRLIPGDRLTLEVSGEFAEEAGRSDANLVIKAAKALARRQKELRLGAFLLEKRLPVAAGLGGGSADAAAALRLIARLNNISPASEAVIEAAQETGSDVSVCLALGCRMMHGRGEILGPRLDLPPLHTVLVNSGERLETRRVFAALGGRHRSSNLDEFPVPGPSATAGEWLMAIAACGNDLERPAIGLAPSIEDARLRLQGEPGCVLARMTGSGATVVGFFEDESGAINAASSVAARHSSWWVRQVTLGA